jgi:hypothetical protein
MTRAVERKLLVFSISGTANPRQPVSSAKPTTRRSSHITGAATTGRLANLPSSPRSGQPEPVAAIATAAMAKKSNGLRATRYQRGATRQRAIRLRRSFTAAQPPTTADITNAATKGPNIPGMWFGQAEPW